jgi:hypothetical protein
MTISDDIVFLMMGPAASLVLMVFVCFHRSRVYALWAQISSILAFIAGVGWGTLGLILIDWRGYHLSREGFYRVLGIKGMLCGIAITVAFCIFASDPYRPKNRATPTV